MKISQNFVAFSEYMNSKNCYGSVACCQTQALIEVSLLFGVYSTDMLKCLLNIYALGEYLSEKQIYDLLQFLCIYGNGMILKSNRIPKEK